MWVLFLRYHGIKNCLLLINLFRCWRTIYLMHRSLFAEHSCVWNMNWSLRYFWFWLWKCRLSYDQVLWGFNIEREQGWQALSSSSCCKKYLEFFWMNWVSYAWELLYLISPVLMVQSRWDCITVPFYDKILK